MFVVIFNRKITLIAVLNLYLFCNCICISFVVKYKLFYKFFKHFIMGKVWPWLTGDQHAVD